MARTIKKSTKLTKKELVIVREVERRVRQESGGFQDNYCWLNGQRAAMCDDRLLYHEGLFRKPFSEGMAHAWNSINGKIVDFSLSAFHEKMHRYAKYYETENAYTKKQVTDAFIARKCQWDWMKQ